MSSKEKKNIIGNILNNDKKNLNKMNQKKKKIIIYSLIASVLYFIYSSSYFNNIINYIYKENSFIDIIKISILKFIIFFITFILILNNIII